jgi:3-oxoacyl-[acyl-carrier-protein] synthase III
MNSRIKSIEYYLPNGRLTNEDLQKEFDNFSAEKIEKKTGIKERRISSDGETALDLAYHAACKLLKNEDKGKIDALILCTQSPEYFLPTTACLLQNKLGLSKNIAAFDINQGCSGFIYGLAIGKAFIASGMAHNILLITSDTYSKYLNPKDKSTRSIFGDGAAAVIIESSENSEIGDFVLGTDGAGAEDLIVKNGGSRNKYFHPLQQEVSGRLSGKEIDNYLSMSGPDVFNFTIKSIPTLFNQILSKNNCSIGELDYVIFHQANKYILNHLRKKIGLSDDIFHIDMINKGNTVSSTIPIALKDSIDKGKITKGDTVLIVGFGVGYSWGGTVIKL